MTEITGALWSLGAGKPQSVNRFVELLGAEGHIEIPKRPGEPDVTWADVTNIATDLEWQPDVRFEDGVAEILVNIEYWRKAPLWDSDSIAEATRSWVKYLEPGKSDVSV